MSLKKILLASAVLVGCYARAKLLMKAEHQK